MHNLDVLFYSENINMKYLTGLLLLLLMQAVSATECRLNGGAWVDPEVHGFNAYVDLVPSLAAGKVFLDDYTFECRHGLPTYFPYEPVELIQTDSDTAVMLYPQPGYFPEGGLNVTGTYYPTPVRGGILLSMQRKEPLVNVLGRPYLNITRAPGRYLQIPSGARIATVRLRVSTYLSGSLIKFFATFVNVYARHSLNLNPSTCTINNNAPIDVDFGSVDPLAVGESPISAPNSKTFVLIYSCPDAGISSPIDITLKGAASSFNSSGLAMSNPNLATVVYRTSTSVAVPIGSSFRGSITNSSGRDSVTFALIRKPGSLPAAGPFTGSATLVMSVP